MNKFETVENVDAYQELANAVVALACDDYRDYKKHFRKNLDLMKYISERMDEIEQSNGGCTGEWDVLETVKADTEFDQRKLLSKISEIEKFLLSDYDMMLSHGLGDVILEKIQKEQPNTEPSAERGKTLFKKKEKQMQKRLKKLFKRRQEVMMYRCENCGNLFEEGEQTVWEETHGLDSPPYETWSGCPACRGDYEEVYQCKECGDWHIEDELYEGWCEKCLRKIINYDTFFEYCEANKEENYLDTFVMCYLLNCGEVPKYPSWEFHQLMIETYKRRVADAKLLKGKFGFLADCICFIMDDDGYSGRENYADWLNNRKVVK